MQQNNDRTPTPGGGGRQAVQQALPQPGRHLVQPVLRDLAERMARAATDGTAILLHPSLLLAGVSMVMERRCQQNSRRAAVDETAILTGTLSTQLLIRLLKGEGSAAERLARAATDETAILLHPSLLLVGVPMVMERRCQQNDRTLVE